MNLNIGNIKIPLNAATKTFAVLAKRGAGKTYTAAVVAEEMHKAGIPFVVFDPIDVWWGLRFASDGKSEGLPVVVFGLEHADIKLERDMGVQIAQAVVKHNISCVISTFGMPKVAQRQLIQEFSEELLRINNKPRHIFIEEAHEFVPQRVTGAMGKCFSAVEALVVMGRNRGIGVSLINQRAATINKDVLTQLDTLLAFRNTAPQDRKAIKDWVEAHDADEDFFKDFMKSLPALPTGEGWIWSPEFMGIFKRIKIRKRETFHPDREKLGESFDMPELDRVDVQSFIDEFSAGYKKPETKEKITKAEVHGNGGSDQFEKRDEEIRRQVRNEYESKLIEKDAEINRLQSVIRQVQNLIGGATVSGSHGGSAVVGEGGGADDGFTPFVMSETNAMLQKLGGMPRSIYERLLQHPNGLTRRQIALMCAYSVNGGGFRNAISKLNTMGLIKKEGDVLKALLR